MNAKFFGKFRLSPITQGAVSTNNTARCHASFNFLNNLRLLGIKEIFGINSFIDNDRWEKRPQYAYDSLRNTITD